MYHARGCLIVHASRANGLCCARTLGRYYVPIVPKVMTMDIGRLGEADEKGFQVAEPLQSWQAPTKWDRDSLGKTPALTTNSSTTGRVLSTYPTGAIENQLRLCWRQFDSTSAFKHFRRPPSEILLNTRIRTHSLRTALELEADLNGIDLLTFQSMF